MSYQLLQDDYTDTPGYGSNPNVQPGNLLQSGGGVAHHVHGGPGAMYSRNAESSDIYGYSTPRQDKFYGQMYGKGPSYMENIDLWTPNSHEQTFNYPYAWDHHSPQNRDTTYGRGSSGVTTRKAIGIEHDLYGKSKKKVNPIVSNSQIENFKFSNDTPVDDNSTTPIEQAFDLIPIDPGQESIGAVKISPYLTF